MTSRTTNTACAGAIAAFDPLILSIVTTATTAALITPNLVTSRREHVGVVAGRITQDLVRLS
jgi:hypothetical protein